MKEILLRQYQADAVDAVQKALDSGQKRMVVEMPAGCGKSVIIAKIVEELNRQKRGKILVITDSVSIKKQTESLLLYYYEGFEVADSENIKVENVQKLTENKDDQINEYLCWIFYNVSNIDGICERFVCKEKIIIAFLLTSG